MRIVTRVLLGIVLLLAVLFGVQVVASESGEVVVIRVTDAAGEERETRVWIFDDGDRAWVRGSPEPGSWASRAAAASEVAIERGDETLARTPERVEDPELQQRVNRGFREKYAWRDTIISWMLGDPDRSDSLILELRDPSA